MAKVRGLLTGIILAAIAVGFAYAMPGAMTVSDPKPPKVKNTSHAPPERQNESGEEESDLEEPEELDVQDEVSGEGEHPENHGAAVSTAAHCDLPNPAHSDLVQTIAHDKDATVAEAEAACAAAQAAVAASGAEAAEGHGNSDKPDKPEKPERGGGHNTDDESDDLEVEAEGDEAPGNSGEDHGGGNDKDKGKD